MAGETSEAVTLTPPDCLGESSIPGDRTTPADQLAVWEPKGPGAASSPPVGSAGAVGEGAGGNDMQTTIECERERAALVREKLQLLERLVGGKGSK